MLKKVDKMKEDEIIKRILESKQEYKKQIFNEFNQLIDNIDENVELDTPDERLTGRLITAYLKDALKELYDKEA